MEPASPRRESRRIEHRREGQRQYDRPDVKKNALKPHRNRQWVIPPEANAGFVAAMEDVLETYQRPRDPDRPLVCLDETSKQLIAETRAPIPPKPGQPARHDYEYQRNGVANLFMMFAPLEGWRCVEVTDHHTAVDYAKLGTNSEHLVLTGDRQCRATWSSFKKGSAMLVSTKCTEARSNATRPSFNCAGPMGLNVQTAAGNGHCLVNRGARRLFQCNACRKQTSVKAGTIFASSKLPLRIWFKAIFLLTQSKKGISLTRARILLKADVSEAGEGWSDSAIAAALPQDDLIGFSVVRCGDRRHERRLALGPSSAPTRTSAADVGVVHLHGAFQSLARVSIELGRRLGVTQTWVMKHKLAQVMLERRRRRRMRARRDQDRRRPASRQNARLQMGQHGAGQHQGGFGRNLSSRTFQACSALSRRVRISVQPQIRSQRHDSASRFCGAQDRAHALPAPEVS